MLRVLKHIIIILLVPISFVSAQEDYILKINNVPVFKSEFQHYFSNSGIEKASDFLPFFINYELQLNEAKRIELDSLTSFKIQLNYLFDSIKCSKTLKYSDNKEVWVRIKGIEKRLFQNASFDEIEKSKAYMDSIYNLIQNGEDFDTIAQKLYSLKQVDLYDKDHEWFNLSSLPNEFIKKIDSSSNDIVLSPLISPSGIHIIKIYEKKDSLVESNSYLNISPEELSINEKYLYNDLLVSYYKHFKAENSLVVDQKELEQYFKKNIHKYYYKEPRFKGAVVLCNTKKMSSVLKKYLKKYSYDQWNDKFRDLTKNDTFKHSLININIFKLGDNKYIDKKVFKTKEKLLPDSNYKYFFVIGDKLTKRPHSYKDVIDSVMIDYLNNKEIEDSKSLNEKYKVEINNDVLKTVNNSGSN